jgi:hypothetical protein
LLATLAFLLMAAEPPGSMPEQQICPHVPAYRSTVFVPTAETSSLRFFLDLMVELRKPIMFVGGAGVGKTQLVKGKLSSLPEEIMSLSISFNYFTDVISFQKVCHLLWCDLLQLDRSKKQSDSNQQPLSARGGSLDSSSTMQQQC